MTEFISFLAPAIDEFIAFRKMSKKWNTHDEGNIKYFDRHCATNFPNARSLTSEMLDTWCRKRDAEKNSSCAKRVYPIFNLVKYLRERGLTDAPVPILPSFEARTYVPHAFTDDELTRFFHGCDNPATTCNNIQSRIRRLTLPVFFRLLYSSGMRTTEVRLLRRSNVDLTNGIVDIQQSKGYAQHFVALHDSIIPLLQKFDESIEKLLPNREYFFTSSTGGAFGPQWVSANFKTIWEQVNSTSAYPYDLRHNYAITNINNWISAGFDFDDKLLYLSKTMGHANVEITKYYYSLVPALADILVQQTNKDFDDIVPEVPNEES